MRETTLPAAVKDAAMANLSTLATHDVFSHRRRRVSRLRGRATTIRGCCHGNCTHVWNYETHDATPVPRRWRARCAKRHSDLAGRLEALCPFRISLPEGKQTGGTTAADGTMGQIIKAYIDWQLSGDDDWLRQIWPR